MRKLGAILFLIIGVISLSANQPISRKLYKLNKSDGAAILTDLKINQNKLKTGSATDLPGTTRYYTWLNTVWTKESTITTNYNVGGFPILELWDMAASHDKKFSYSYNQDNNITQTLCRVLDNGIWKDSTRERWEFNDHKDQAFYVYEEYRLGAWVISEGYRSEFEYSGSLLMTEIYSAYNTESSDWKQVERYTYTYKNGRLVGEIVEVYTNGAWVTDLRYTDFLDSQGRVDSSYIEIWSGTAWEKGALEKFSYTGAHGMGIIMYEYDTVGKVYNQTDRWYQDYNSQGNLIFLSWEGWSGTAWELFVGMRVADTLEGQHIVLRLTEIYNYDWIGGTGGLWENYTRQEFSDFVKLGTDPLLTPSPGITCYPNPAGSQTMVRFTLPNTGNFVLTVFSLNGQKVLEQSFSPGSSQFEYQLNLDKVPTGSYILVASELNGNALGMVRLIKQ